MVCAARVQVGPLGQTFWALLDRSGPVCPTAEGQGGVDAQAGRRERRRSSSTGGRRRFELDGLGVIDETDGYHPRHTVWSWSAGVGRTTDGQSVGWNLVEGVNDPPERSERAIWVDGKPFEPGPVSFDGLDAIGFDDGSRLTFEAETERRKSENRLIVRYSYRQPFGSFSGTLPGGLELEHGLGVMEHHDALW